MSCLSPELAVDFVAGALPRIPAQEVEGHMARCHECRRLIVEIAKANSAPDTDLDAGLLSQRTPGWAKPSESHGEALELRRGTRVGRYTLLYPLGEGGMGSVYAAFDPKLDRRVALKFLRTDLVGAPKEGHRDRLVREARALARLSHPNVVSIFDAAEIDGSVFLAMELIDGSNARIWRELGNRSIEEVLRIYRGSLSALMAAHEQGIIHRDFKPDNVMVGSDGIARVTDFGLARSAMVDVSELFADADAKGANWETLTQTGLVLGTPRYMAPEQFSGLANELTDQFSFCLSLYEALYGHYPFGTKTPRLLERDRDIAEQVLSPLASKVPDNLRRILLKGMAVDPGERWQNIRELEVELAHCLDRKATKLHWAGLAGVAALVASAAIFLAPDAPPHTPVELHDYATENARLRQEAKERRELDDELRQTRSDLLELTRRLGDRDRELAFMRLAEEEEEEGAQKPRRSTHRPPLPVQSVERSVTTRLSEVLACYESSVVDDEEEIIKVNVGIDSSGIVKWVAPPFQGSQIASRCLEAALKRLSFPAGVSPTTATLHLSFFRLESGLLAVNMRAKTRNASHGQVTVDSKGRVLVDCTPSDPLCGL